jgi:uncharacterized protein DUF1259/chromate transporter
MAMNDSSAAEAPPKVSMRELVSYFLRLGLMGFGGPVALVEQMEKELVGERKWLTREQMREAVLRTNGIEVTAIHSHMLSEQPRVFFVHFWANDDALKLANGLRAALDKTAIAR